MADGAVADGTALRLLWFHREPSRYRNEGRRKSAPRLAPEVVLKLALGRRIAFDDPALNEPDTASALANAAVVYVREVYFRPDATPYQTLGVEPSASPEQIRECFRLLMQLVHPDRQDAHGLWPDAYAAQANRAYAILRDEPSRARFDREAEARAAMARAMHKAAAASAASIMPAVPRPAPRFRHRSPLANALWPDWLSAALGGYVREHPATVAFSALVIGALAVIVATLPEGQENVITTMARERAGARSETAAKGATPAMSAEPAAKRATPATNAEPAAKVEPAAKAATLVHADETGIGAGTASAATTASAAATRVPAAVPASEANAGNARPPAGPVAGIRVPTPVAAPAGTLVARAAAAPSVPAIAPAAAFASVATAAPGGSTAPSATAPSAAGSSMPAASAASAAAVPRGAAAGPVAPSAPEAPVSSSPLAPVVATAPAGPAARSAPAPAAAELGPPPSAAEVEALLAAFVDSYERGRLDAFAALFDDDAESNLRRGRVAIRGMYDELFRTSEWRRMRLMRINWRHSGERTYANGEIAVRIGWRDGREVEQRVNVDMELVRRDGRAVIARLSEQPKAP